MKPYDAPTQDGTARVWDERTGGAAAVLRVPQPAHSAAAGRGLVLVGDECGTLTAFDLRRPSAPLYALKSHRDVVRGVAFSEARRG